MRLHPLSAGLTLGILSGGWHLLWSLLVASGLAQQVLDFVFWMHFIRPAYSVEPFAIDRALILVALSFGIGFGFGAVLALVWNRLSGASPGRVSRDRLLHVP